MPAFEFPLKLKNVSAPSVGEHKHTLFLGQFVCMCVQPPYGPSRTIGTVWAEHQEMFSLETSQGKFTRSTVWWRWAASRPIIPSPLKKRKKLLKGCFGNCALATACTALLFLYPSFMYVCVCMCIHVCVVVGIPVCVCVCMCVCIYNVKKHRFCRL